MRRRRRPAYAPPPVHTDAAHAAITAELVRLTLGGRPDRPELAVRGEGIEPPTSRV